MIPTLVVVAALAVGAHQPIGDVPLHKVPGPAFLIPCKVEAAEVVARVQLWVSADGGRKWEMYEEITPDRSAFTFVARKAGEYWFAPRIKKKDGTAVPSDTADLIATQRVAVETGSDGPAGKPTVSALADELDEELTRTELELVRKEIKRLSELTELTPEAADKFDLARRRLRDIRDRLRRDRDGDRGLSATLPAQPGVAGVPGPYAEWGPPAPSPLRPPAAAPLRMPAPDDGRAPPAALPADPLVTPVAPMPAPVRPAAPTPRAPGRSS